MQTPPIGRYPFCLEGEARFADARVCFSTTTATGAASVARPDRPCQRRRKSEPYRIGDEQQRGEPRCRPYADDERDRGALQHQDLHAGRQGATAAEEDECPREVEREIGPEQHEQSPLRIVATVAA